jgi:hypothetical protein
MRPVERWKSLTDRASAGAEGVSVEGRGRDRASEESPLEK